MTLLPTMSRPGCTVRVMCSVTVEVRGATESGSAEVLSSQRSCYSTECEETGHLLPTSGGGGWGRSYTRPLPLEVKKYVVVLFSFWPDVQYKCNSGDTILHECMKKFIC